MGDVERLSGFLTLFLVIDPIGTAPLFVALTRGMDRAKRRAIGFKACAIAAAILTFFGLCGSTVLDLLGISLPAFRIAGGLLLFLIAVEMLFDRGTARHEADTPGSDRDPSVFPLAVPLIAGPGAMATMILLASGGAGWGVRLQTQIAMLAVIGLVLAPLLVAGAIERVLGCTGIAVLTRLLGILLGAISVQFVIDGFHELGIVAAVRG